MLADDDIRRRLLERFTRVHRRKAERWAYRWLHDTFRAEDAVQDAFYQALKGLHTYDLTRPFDAWMFRIVNRSALAILRRERQRGEIELLDDRLTDGQNVEAEVSERVEYEASLSQIMLAVRRLSSKERFIIVEAYLKETPYEELAAHMNMAEPALRMQLSRTRLRIQTLLGAQS